VILSSDSFLALLCFFLFGICFGSFANVVIYRWPKGLSVVRPRSRCPSCEKLISWYDNIPLFSWVLLKGRCRTCRTSISPRYLLIELSVGVLFALVFLFYGFQFRSLEYAYLCFGLFTISVIDLEHYLIPDILSLSGILIGLIGGIINPEREWFDGFAGALLGGGFLWATAFFYTLIRKEDGMGGGDIKLMAWIGAVLGWRAIPFVILGSSLVGAVVGLVVARRAGTGLKTALPFGPFISAAAIIYIFGGHRLAGAYLRLFWPDLPGFDI